MKSLFEKQEREQSVRALKIDLISRFYPLSNIEVVKYKDTLNLDREHLMKNESIQWDMDLVETLKEKIDWSAIRMLKKLKIGIPFIKKFEALIDFKSLQSSDNIEWSDELIEQYGDKFYWETWLINKEPLSTVNNLRRFRDKLDWSRVSRGVKLKFTDEIIEEFKDRWDWKKLSANPCLSVDLDFLIKYVDRLDFDELSMNKAILPLIYKYPKYPKWNWDKVILNRGLIYNQEAFEFMFSNFKKHWEEKEHKFAFMKNKAFPVFLNRILMGFYGDLNFFLSPQFIPHIHWDTFSKYCKVKLSMEFIEANKEKLNFKESELVRQAKSVLTSDFISQNHMLFNKQSYLFYYLPLSINLIRNFIEDINWNLLSSCETLDWNWEFIETHFDQWNFHRLGLNKRVYENLVAKNNTPEIILAILEK